MNDEDLRKKEGESQEPETEGGQADANPDGEAEKQPQGQADANQPDADGLGAETPTANQEGDPDATGEANDGGKSDEPERTFTQSQVNELVGKARMEGRQSGYDQARKEAYDRYGVKDEDELDGLFQNGSRYSELSQRYDDYGNQLTEAKSELAMMKSGISDDRQADVRAILGANGLDVTEENIKAFLPTHPEWTEKPDDAKAGQATQIPQPNPSAQKLGFQPSDNQDDDGNDEGRERAMKLFGL